MTRINTVEVHDLTDQHLMAEYRELPMVNASLRRTLSSKRGLDRNRIPPRYTLNAGHVYHFYDKGRWLFERYNALIAELKNRGYSIDPSQRKVDWDVFRNSGLFLDWRPDNVSKRINAERIVERINAKPWWYKYGGKPTVDEQFVQRFKNKYITGV